MQAWILGILGFIFVMGLAVLVHEIGHFVAARKFGVRCHQFAIGMGPALWKKRKGETLYKICAVPIGGYVMMGTIEGERDLIKEGTEIGLTLGPDGHVIKIHVQPEDGQIAGVLISNTLDISTDLQVVVSIAGERRVYPVSHDAWYVDSRKDQEQQIVPNDKMLEQKPKLQRFIIMVAGAVMNFILAYILVLIVGAFLGEPISLTTYLDTVNPGMPAYEAGLLPGDQLVAIDGVVITEETHVRFTSSEETLVEFIRDGDKGQVYVTPVEEDGRYVTGIQIRFKPEYERSLAGTFRYANLQFRNGFMLIFDTLRMLGTGEAGVGDLSGPVGIAHMISHFAAQGFLPLLVFASLININLGIFNLLPLPALDGGHITFIVIEAIIGKPVSPKIQNGVAIVGLVLFMGLFIFTFFNDIFRFIIQ